MRVKCHQLFALEVAIAPMPLACLVSGSIGCAPPGFAWGHVLQTLQVCAELRQHAWVPNYVRLRQAVADHPRMSVLLRRLLWHARFQYDAPMPGVVRVF